MHRMICITAVALFCMICHVQASDTGALISQRCTSCHGMDKNCEPTSTDVTWWETTVERMVSYDRDVLNPEESKTVSAFLANASRRATLCP